MSVDKPIYLRMLATGTGVVVALTLSISSGCRKQAAQVRTAEQTHQLLIAAAKATDGKALFSLLDEKTRWSIISAYQARQQAVALVKKHYPPARQARELARAQAAIGATDAASYLHGLLQRQPELIASLSKAGQVDRIEKRGELAIVQSGPETLRYCRTPLDPSYYFCGLREQFERLNVRAARDLTTVRENAEAFSGR